MPDGYPIKGCAEINLHDASLPPTLQCTLQCMGYAQKCITGTQIFFDMQTGRLGAHHGVPYIVQDEQTPGAQTHLTILMSSSDRYKYSTDHEMVGNWQQRSKVDLS